MMIKVLCVLFLLSVVSLSETASQTNWSGGDGVPGPVTDWGNTYDVSVQIDSTGGTLRLITNILTTPIENILDDDFDGPWSICTADVDGDGDMDVLGAATNDETITWWENIDGSGTEWIEHTVAIIIFGAWSVDAADIDDDGDIDILGTGLDDYYIRWWENADCSGTTWIEHIVGIYTSMTIIQAADIDGDGDMDILSASILFPDGHISWWENSNGSGTEWSEHIVTNDFLAESIICADIDGDGNMDVLSTGYHASRIKWWENKNGSGTSWTVHDISGFILHASSVYAADIDGDGDMDVLGAANNVIKWWENNDGSGTYWTGHLVDGDFEQPKSVYSEDIDGDGDMDVLGASWSTGTINWWENTNGSGTGWNEYTVTNDFQSISSICAVDVNGDSSIDVLGAAYYEDSIVWWDLLSHVEEGTLESSILDAGSVREWQDFSSNLQEPAGTSVAFQFRSSQNPEDMGAWSDTIFSSSTPLSGLLADSTQYLQYKVILETSDSLNTPSLEDVTFTYTVSGSGISSDPLFWTLIPKQNPSFGSLSILISIPENGMIDLTVFDITGRIIAKYSQEFPIGTHTVTWSGITEGVYFCRMQAGNSTATERMVVLD